MGEYIPFSIRKGVDAVIKITYWYNLKLLKICYHTEIYSLYPVNSGKTAFEILTVYFQWNSRKTDSTNLTGSIAFADYLSLKK